MDNEKYIAEITNRYIFEVTKRMPQAQREDIDKEFRGLIEDMLSDRTESPTSEDIDEVLIELGKPSELAEKYRGAKRYLIGPEYFDTYTLVLRIVLLAAGFGISVASIIGFLVTPPADGIEAFASFLTYVISALFQAFTWVTIGFALAERYSKKKSAALEDKWKPASLPKVPVEKAVIKRSEPIAGMVFIVLFIIIFNYAPQLIGVYILDKSIAIPLFNIGTLKNIILLFNIVFCIGLLKELFKLVTGKYTLKLAAVICGLNVVAVIITVMIFSNQNLWNTNVLEALKAVEGFQAPSDSTLIYYFGMFTRFFIGIFIFSYVIETLTFFYKAVKYKA